MSITLEVLIARLRQVEEIWPEVRIEVDNLIAALERLHQSFKSLKVVSKPMDPNCRYDVFDAEEPLPPAMDQSCRQDLMSTKRFRRKPQAKGRVKAPAKRRVKAPTKRRSR
jgi:hypothetical protein